LQVKSSGPAGLTALQASQHSPAESFLSKVPDTTTSPHSSVLGIVWQVSPLTVRPKTGLSSPALMFVLVLAPVLAPELALLSVSSIWFFSIDCLTCACLSIDWISVVCVSMPSAMRVRGCSGCAAA
jgi:hypothetical protein